MKEQNINIRRAVFVYEAARLEASLSEREIVPEVWASRDDEFRAQFVWVVSNQCAGEKFKNAEEAHNSWRRGYEQMGWRYGPVRDTEARTHPDMVPFLDLPKDERDKDEIFLRLCYVAKAIE